jgi:hypothetical protein
MAALTDDRDTPEKASTFGMEHAFVAASSLQFFKGGILCIDQADGLLKKGTTSATLVAIGRSEERILTGAGNTRKIRARSGIFKYDNSGGGDAIAADDVGKDCFIVDDQTVALTDGTGTRSRAGEIYDVDADGVWVAFTFPHS